MKISVRGDNVAVTKNSNATVVPPLLKRPPILDYVFIPLQMIIYGLFNAVANLLL